ncbi:hypothetical protein [Bacillus sp. 1P06AnD]|uniref:hypothetical protein n=1 Tax=Bacillus sp. 1P06AnD TaxID=3132208 RepID=UPI0039A0F4BA
MKKLISIFTTSLLCLMVFLTLSACSEKSSKENEKTTPSSVEINDENKDYLQHSEKSDSYELNVQFKDSNNSEGMELTPKK